MADYRDSHQNPKKGVEYHAKFSKNPHRSMIWAIEKTVLSNLVASLFNGVPFRHLDFACGTGRIVEHLRAQAQLSVGVDVSESMLVVARSRLPDCELINADITRADVLGGRKFDLITAFRFFPNAQDELRRDAIGRLVDHLDSNGYLVFNNHKNHSSLAYRVGRILTSRPLGEMREKEVEEMLTAAGLRVVCTYHMGVIPSTDKYRIAPVRVLDWFERRLAKLPSLRSLASNVVYVCSRV